MLNPYMCYRLSYTTHAFRYHRVYVSRHEEECFTT